MMNAFVRPFSVVAASVLFAACLAQEDAKKKDAPAAAKEGEGDSKKIYRRATPEKLEAVFKRMNIDFKKVKGKSDGIWLYDYEKNDYKIRVHNYLGNDLWIDAHFSAKTPLEDVNDWNTRAKFSRAVQLKEKQAVSLEAQLDCGGGVTDGIIRQFIERFDGELVQFTKFLSR
jgi:hypothetical protein